MMKKSVFFSGLLCSALLAFAACSDSNVDTPDTPVIQAETPAPIAAPGGAGTLRYTIANPVVDAHLTAVSDQTWLEIGHITADAVAFTAGIHTGDEPRTAKVKLDYPGAEAVEVILTQQVPTTPKTLTFEIEILNVTSRTVTVNCTPSDLNATYIAMASTKADFDSYPTEEELYQSNIDYFLEWGPAFGATTPEEAIGMFLRTGKMENYEIQLDSPQSEYYFYAYGMNLDRTITSPKLYSVAFETVQPEQQECTFRFTVRPGIAYTQVNVFPSSIYVPYLWGVMAKDEYDALGDDPAQRIVDDIKAQFTGEDRFGEQVFYHNRKASYTKLEAGKEYVVYAFGSDVTGFVTTPIMTHTFVEKRLERVDCDFSMSFRNIRASSFAVNITPTNGDIRWFAYTLPYEVLENYLSIDAMTEDVIDILIEQGIDLATDEEYAHTGTQLLSSYNLMGSELDPRTKQIVGAFGLDADGYRVTEISQGVVTTIEAGRPSDLTVDIAATTSGYASAEVRFTPSGLETYFYDLQPKEYYETFDTDESFMNEMLYYYGSTSLLPYKMAVGEATMTVEEQLKPGTTYLGVAFGVDKNISTPLFKGEFTTGSVPMGGTATVERIDYTVEDGDAYYARNPSAYAACKGMAVVTFSLATSAGAKGYLVNYSQIDATITDQQLTDLIVGYGDSNPADMAYILPWNELNIAAALALDAAGKAGPVLRRELTPTKADVKQLPMRRATRVKTPGDRTHVLLPQVPNYVLRPRTEVVLSSFLHRHGCIDSASGTIHAPAAPDGSEFGAANCSRPAQDDTSAALPRPIRDLITR